jgi:hypothetical protein
MSDRSDVHSDPDTSSVEDSATLPDSLQTQKDEIPVDELIRLTRELTERITNLDRQRMTRELRDWRRAIKTNAPITLQQFFTGEIDLDSELAKRYVNAPLFSEIRLRPKRPAAVLPSRRAVALLSSQDNAAQMTVDLDIKTGEMDITFTLGSMLAFRFEIGILDDQEKQRWLDLMRRQSGIAFLWQKERWERDYIIFVVRENFARLYAFSPNRFEAAARITPDVLVDLLDWIEAFWFPDLVVHIAPPQEIPSALPGASVKSDYFGYGAPSGEPPTEDAWPEIVEDPYDPPDEEW